VLAKKKHHHGKKDINPDIDPFEVGRVVVLLYYTTLLEAAVAAAAAADIPAENILCFQYLH
jgi:hypothetical protein